MSRLPGNKDKGFTLIELLVVMAIIGMLAFVGIANYQTSLARGRDSRRKGDLKNIAQALDLYWADREIYPSADNGRIAPCRSSDGACPYLTWGGGAPFLDPDNTSTVYMKSLPADPSAGEKYYYQVSSDGKAYKLWTGLEISKDRDSLTNPDSANYVICTGYGGIPPLGSCGALVGCNFARTSSNVSMCSDSGFTF